MKEQIHHAQSRYACDKGGTGQRFMPQGLFLCLIQFVVMTLVVVSGQQEAASATGGVVHCLAGRRAHYVHDCLDESTRREVLSRPSLHVCLVFLYLSLVVVAIYNHFLIN